MKMNGEKRMTDKYACFTGLLDTGIGITENDKELTGDDVARILNKLTEENLKLKEDYAWLKKTDNTIFKEFREECGAYSQEIKDMVNEKEIILEKLLTMILDYDKISNDNWNMGLSEAVESLHDEVQELFENPMEFTITMDCDECKYYRELEYTKGKCIKRDKEVDGLDKACDKFEWK